MQVSNYTFLNTPEAEERIQRDQDVIAQAVGKTLHKSLLSVVMIGGYGRGEGGIYNADSALRPYNDYDYFLVLEDGQKYNEKKRYRELLPIKHELEEKLQIEVDFAITYPSKIRKLKPTLMNAEMLWGHRVICGDADILRQAPKIEFDHLPLGEFTRLMFNRGNLLLLNKMHLDAGNFDLDEAYKFCFKAILACGDAMLARNSSYHPSYIQKCEILWNNNYYNDEILRALYPIAVGHKMDPSSDLSHLPSIQDFQVEAVNLWIKTFLNFEQFRLNKEITLNDYLDPSLDKGQFDNTSKLKNIILNLRDINLRFKQLNLRNSTIYPRCKLISLLPTLLSNGTQRFREHINRDYGFLSTAHLEQDYIQLWHKYS